MMDRKWTPGPWRISYERGTTQIRTADNESIMCDMTYYPWVPENDADWNLIAAAPDLYEALEVTIGYIEWMIEDGCKQCGGDCSSANPPVQYCPLRIMRADLDTARAALTKAEGKWK